MVTAALAALAGSLFASKPAQTAPSGVDGVAGNAFASPVDISGYEASMTLSNDAATAQPGEPSHADSPSGAPDLPDHSIWFRWTSPVTGRVTFRTRDSDFDTVMAAYKGSSLTSLTRLASNDDTELMGSDGTPEHTTSQLGFAAVKGVTYRIAVDSFTGTFPPEQVDTGVVHLSWNANDDFSGAQILSGPEGPGVFLAEGDTNGATSQPGEPLHDGRMGGRSLWYSWTAPKSGTVSFDTAPSHIDTLLAAYTGKNVAQLTEIASNDDVPGARTSKITFAAKGGTTYKIAVDGYVGTLGLATLRYHYGS